MRVLIVDDNEAMRRTIRTVVQDLADEILECSSGLAALESYQTFKPDWVLMDIRMKDLDGLSATREIKRAFADARVIIVTSYDELSLREEAAAAGACAYVIKDNLKQLARLLGPHRNTSSDQA
ncbi:MAG TPA: response regulator transcription factor [Pyrinomonadaceae bacterium]|nr:response regulator transcription factor [Pyrinomonadaceae bacterium]